jgi:hypothetical protein
MKQQLSGASVLLWQERGLSMGQLGALPYGTYALDGVLKFPKGSRERRPLAKVLRDRTEGISRGMLMMVSTKNSDRVGRCFV